MTDNFLLRDADPALLEEPTDQVAVKETLVLATRRRKTPRGRTRPAAAASPVLPQVRRAIAKRQTLSNAYEPSPRR